jgi:hypothetical protein
MTQVDLGLTGLTGFDRADPALVLMTVIKNLGRHTTSRRSQVYSAQAPGSTWQGHQARTSQGGLHSRRKILGCPVQVGRDTRAHRPRKVTHPGCPTRLAEHRGTEVLQDLSIKERRPQGGCFLVSR